MSVIFLCHQISISAFFPFRIMVVTFISAVHVLLSPSSLARAVQYAHVKMVTSHFDSDR
jgi:hypothetical protein